MALIKGVNCGFVDVAPSGDPGESTSQIDDRVWALKDTLPGGANKITEIGWYCFDTNVEANYEVGIYAHDDVDNEPGVLLFSDITIMSATPGWKRVTGLDIVVSPSTAYWIAVQLDDTPARTDLLVSDEPGEKIDRKLNQSELTDPWGNSESSFAMLVSIYAVIGSAAIVQESQYGSLVKMDPALEAGPGLYV